MSSTNWDDFTPLESGGQPQQKAQPGPAPAPAPSGGVNWGDFKPVSDEPPARGLKGFARDAAAWGVKGAIAVPEAIVGLADIPTGGAVGKFLENEGGAVGFRPKQAKEMVNEWHSDATKEAQRKFQEADGIGGKFQAAIENPSNIVGAIAESLPSMGASGVAARGLMAATRLGRMGAEGAALAAAAGEGITGAGSAAEQIRQETKDGLLTPGQSAAALATGAATGAFGVVGGKVANRLGIGDADTMIAQGSKGMAKQYADDAARAAANPLAAEHSALRAIPTKVLQGAISEGFLEELPQSVSEQILQNLALDKPWSEGVDAAAVMGVLSGGAMGGAASGYRAFLEPSAKPGEQQAPEQPKPLNQDAQPADQPQAQQPNPGMQRLKMDVLARLREIQQQEQGEPDVPQSTPPDGAAVLARQQAQAQAARDAQIAADRAVESPDDEILQSIGMANLAPAQPRASSFSGVLDSDQTYANWSNVRDGTDRDIMREQMATVERMYSGKVTAENRDAVEKELSKQFKWFRVSSQEQKSAAVDSLMTQSESQAMGLRSGMAAGSLEKAAALAVDTGASAQVQQATMLAQAAEEAGKKGGKPQKQEQPAQAGQGIDKDSGEISSGSQLADWSDADLSTAFRAAQSRDVRVQLANELAHRRALREQRDLQAEMDAEQSAPESAAPDSGFASVREDAGPVPKSIEVQPTTNGAPADGKKADQAQQGSAQPAQGAGAQAGQPATPAGLTHATATVNDGAQAAPQAGPQTPAQSGEIEALRQQLRDVEARIIQAAPAVMGQGGGDIEAAMKSRKVPVTLKAQRKKLVDQIRQTSAQADAVAPQGAINDSTALGIRVADERAAGAAANAPAGSGQSAGRAADAQSPGARGGRSDKPFPGVQSAVSRGGGSSEQAAAVAPSAQAEAVATAAHEAATSQQNDLPEPTEAQKEAGNYRKGHVRLNGHDISIENPAGSRRHPEWPPLKNHYGYFKGSVGADKDHVDVFMTDRAHEADLPVFVVDQVNKDGSFDEHKVVMGAADEAEARSTYLGNYAKGWTGLGAITQMTQDEFKDWVRDPAKTKKPAGKLAPTQATSSNMEARRSAADDDTRNATPVPTGELPAERQGRAGGNAAPGNGNRQSVDDGLAQAREGAAAGRPVPAAADRAGGSGAPGVQQSGEQASGPARDSGDVRPEQRSADAVEQADPATAESSPKPELDESGDHTINADDIGKGGLSKKYRDNIEAIRILKAMDADGRVATPAERRAIARYVGWGALKGVFDKDSKQWAKEYAELRELLTDAEYKAARASTLNAHFTSPQVVNGIFQVLDRLGFKHGRVLEPSVGVGNFFGLMPAAMRKGSQLHGVELDPLTSKIVAALYPSARIAQATGFQSYEVPGGYFDLAIGNPPFGSEPIVDDARSPYSGASIHNYFFAKSIDKLRPGGLLAMVVSHNFLDAKNETTRRWIADRANLVAAVRLPNTAFKENAGTEVVTDIVVFQKKEESERVNGIGDDSWVKAGTQSLANPKTNESTEHSVSQYFLDNPANVLGTPTAAGSMYRAGEYTVEPTGKLDEQLKAWADQLPQGLYQPVERTHEPEAANVSVPDGVKVGSFFVDDTGKVHMRGEDAFGARTATAWTPQNAKAKDRMVGMIGLRDALRTQMRLERSPEATEKQIEAHRRDLNAKYDAFNKSFGYVNDPTNRRIFLDDTESALLLALEFDYDRGVSKAVAEREDIEPRAPSAKKADIFERRVMFPPADNIKVSNAKDAMLASLNYKGALDLDYMASLYDKPVADIVSELGDTIYADPIHGTVMADEYLSGDVKTKLAEAEAAALDDPAFKRNVAALRKVIPADKKPSEIHAAMGANFIPAEYFEQFAKEVTGATAKVTYLRATGQWLVDFRGEANQALNTGKWGIAKMKATDIFARTMAGQGVVVTETYRNADGSTTTVVLEKETAAAREKQSAMKAEWQRWLWSDPDRADKLSGIYNDKMNRIVVRKFDGSHMTFPGMSPAMELLPHQKNAVWRALQSRQVLLDHVVGAGKTFEVVALFMEMRRLGIARKPFIAVPNHLTLQWRSEFSRLYPAANVLAATPDDFAKGNREKFFSKIVTGDWDAVIVGHSSLKKIALPLETEKAILEEQITELAQAIEEMKRARGDRNIVRDMEGIKARLEARMKQRLQALGERDNVVSFDDLGVDAFGIDELHEFKNLFYNSTMERVPGMGNPGGSDKAFDLFVKLQWMFDTYGDKAPIAGATGTPVSNSLVEMFNMQRFLQYPALKQSGLHVFDAWAKQFGSVESLYEVAPSGTGYRQSSRFAKFKNLSALMGMYQTFADTVTLDDLKEQEIARGKSFPVPKVAGGRPVNVVAKRSPHVANFMGVPQLDIQGGRVQFGFNGTDKVEVKKSEHGDNYTITATGEDADGKPLTYSLGTAKTPEDASLVVVEQALSPKIKVDPNSILGQFSNLKQLTKETKGKVNALSLTGQANKAGLDYRLIDPSAPDFEGSKINLAIGRMMNAYQKWAADKGAQLVFCDLSVPLSARSGFASKERRVYVRDQGALVHKKGTMHTVAGHEQLPFFVVKEGGKDSKAFAIYDAATGLRIHGGLPAKGIATDWAAQTLADAGKRQRWINARDALGDIEQDAIDDYNNANEIDTEETESISLADIAGASGAQAFSVYDDIKAKLMARGVPEREIAFIHDYGTPIAKDKLFKQVKRGDVRFLLGSTPKMGAGTNVQDRLVALHHIDAPWRPSDLEQREGRIIRRGNVLYERDPDGFEVEVYRYATEQTYDTRRWQILEHKARGIEQLRNYDGSLNEIDDIEGEAANSADMKAAASGDPLILEETQLRNDVRRLEALQASHADETSGLVRRARDQQRFADEWGPKDMAKLQELQAAAQANPVPKDGFADMKVAGKRAGDREAAIEAMKKAMARVLTGEGAVEPIHYRGIEFTLEGSEKYFELNSPTGNLLVARPELETLPSIPGFLTRFANYVDRLPAHIENLRAKIAEAKVQAVQMREQAAKPFEQAADLDAAREAHKRVQRRLIAKGPDIPVNQRAQLKSAMEQQKEALRAAGYGEALDEFLGGRDDFAGVKPGRARSTSPTDRAIMDMVREGQSAQDILRLVAGTSRSRFNRQVARLLLKMGVTPSVALEQSDLGSGGGFTFAAKYSRQNDAITLTAAAESRAEQIFLHEAIHAATLRALDRKGLHSLQMRRLYEHVKRQGGAAGQYGMKNVGEFVAEAFTNPDFQKALRQMSAPPGGTLKSAWDSFVRILRSILGLPQDANDALSQALELGVAVMREDKALRQRMADRVGADAYMAGDLSDAEKARMLKADQQQDDDAYFGTADLNRIKTSALDQINAAFTHEGKVSAWDKTVGTMRNLAERSAAFKPVYESAQRNIDDVSMLANDAANTAPRLLPRVETLADLKKKPVSAEDNKAVAKPLFEGTLMWARDLDGKPVLADDLNAKYASTPVDDKARMLLKAGKIEPGMLKAWQGMPIESYEKAINTRFESKMLKAGVVWTDAELRSMFNATPEQISLYREARKAIDRSIDMAARADMLRAVGEDYAPMRDAVLEQESLDTAAQLLIDTLEEDAKADPDQRDRLATLMQQVRNRLDQARDLQEAGYAPLSRFGRYTLDVMGKDGERLYFGMYETQRESNLAKIKLAQGFPGATITQGTMSEQAYKLFAGVTPETLEQFGTMLGLKAEGNEAQDKAFQEYLKLTKNNHSALKRLIHRKGIAGYSEDVGRVLANFVYSNARAGAMGLNAGQMDKAIEAIPKEQGELKDLAVGLRDYIRDPQEEGQAVRGMLFAQYLGGSVASAFVNMTQPFQITMPWLSQYGGMKQAGAQLARAVKDMSTKGFKYEDGLAHALKHAEDDGVVSPQEVHQLMAQARGAGTLRSGDGTRLGDARAKASNLWEQGKVLWGQPFALAEQFNRRSTFIAAYRIAKERGMASPAEFARQAVLETQFVYSKANKPKWARGAIGGTLFTFKTYSVSYLELMHRMWTQGGPEGKRAVGWAVAMLLLMGGAGGLPFVEDAEDLIDGAGQLMGYNVSAKQWRKQLLRDVVGKELGDFVEQGVSGLPGAPVDVSGRLGMGNLIPGTGLLLTKQNRERDLLEIAGPAGDLVSRGFTGARKALTGDLGGAALEVAPTAVRNAFKGADMAASGMYKDTKGYKVLDTTLAEAAAKAIGFQPHSVAERQEATSFMLRSESFYRQQSAEIKAQWADALFRKDDAALQRVRERLADWNRDNPDQHMVVKMPDIWKKVREMGKDRTQRIADTAPKALRQEMREMAREAGH